MNLYRNRTFSVVLRFVLFAFLFLIPSIFPVNAQTVQTKNGYKIEVSIKADKEIIMLDEPTFLSFEIKNFSPDKLCLGVGGDYRNSLGRPNRFRVEVKRNDGKSVPQPDSGPSSGGLMGCEVIPANGSHVIKLFLAHWATFEDTGTYTINVQREMGFSSYSKESDEQVIDFRADVSTKIQVIPKDDAQMGMVISSLGNQMLDIKNSEANKSALALAYIKDKRTIPYFAKAVEKFGEAEFGRSTENYWVASTAIKALSKFDDEAAIAVLEAATNNKSNDIRLHIADAFSRSKNPKAFELLLKMQRDNYWFVRLRVVQKLKGVKTEESLNLLKKMIDDENEDVRKTAVENYNELAGTNISIPAETCSIRQTSAFKVLQSPTISTSSKDGSTGVFTTHDCREALKLFLQELPRRRAEKDSFGEAWILTQLGDIYIAILQDQEAFEAYRQALSLFRDLNNYSGKMETLGILSYISKKQKNFQLSLDFLEEELKIVREAESEYARKFNESLILDKIASVYFAWGQDAKGFEYLEKRLVFEREQNSKVGQSVVYEAIGAAYEANGKKAEALKAYQKSLELLLPIANKFQESLFTESINNLRTAIERLKNQ